MAERVQIEVSPTPVPLHPAPRSPHPVSGLPSPLTRLLGREREVEAVQALLLRDDVRLVTLTGPGGVGKTRLAVEVAASLEDAFPDGIVFVSLAPLSEPEAVLPTIANTLAVRELAERSTLETLQGALRSRRLLLLLDSFEPVLSAAPALAELLAACPTVKALVTSRARLRLRGERVVPIAPLELPEVHADPQHLLASPAVALFVERAQDLRPDFALTAENSAVIGETVRRMEGLPLAIELAAARLDLFSPAALLARLERRLPLLTGGAHDLPERLQTMQAAIAWSYDLLPADRQQVFRHLAVCRGSFSLATAAACADLDEAATLEALAALVEQSLVQRVEEAGEAPEAIPRFIMLDTIREFAEQQLHVSGEEDQVRRLHAYFFLALAEEATNGLGGPLLHLELARLDAEQDQLREALRWAIASDPATGFRIVFALYRYWYLRGRISEIRDWLERALAASPSPSVERAKALFCAGHAAIYQGDRTVAVAHLEEALRLARNYGEPAIVADTLFVLGTDAEDRGDYACARARLSEALDIFVQGNDRFSDILTRCHLGLVAYADGDLDAARIILEEAQSLAAEQCDALAQNVAMAYLAIVYVDAGEHAAAAGALLRCLEADPTLGHQESISRALSILAVLASERNEPLQAARLFGAASAMADELGFVAALPERSRFDRARATARGLPGATAFDVAFDAGRSLSKQEVVEEAMTFARSVIAAEPPRVTLSPVDTQLEPSAAAGLTTRELDVLQLLADGRTNPEIADALYISSGTVRVHVSHILEKLDARTRTEAAAAARRRGLLSP